MAYYGDEDDGYVTDGLGGGLGSADTFDTGGFDSGGLGYNQYDSGLDSIGGLGGGLDDQLNSGLGGLSLRDDLDGLGTGAGYGSFGSAYDGGLDSGVGGLSGLSGELGGSCYLDNGEHAVCWTKVTHLT